MTTFTTEDRLNATRGAGDGREMSYQEIANELGVSTTMVMLMERSALAKIKKILLWRHNVEKSEDLI